VYWYFAVLKKYAVFEGRARRKEYWLFYLFTVIIGILLFIGVALWVPQLFNPFNVYYYTLPVLLPSIAVTVRRLHDTNRSGLWMFIAFIPLLGDIVLIIFLVQDSQPGANRFGPNPKVDQKSEISPAITPDGTPEIPWD
jgi:uncharacterized membrane protein YhaH (DUF805 family)